MATTRGSGALDAASQELTLRLKVAIGRMRKMSFLRSDNFVMFKKIHTYQLLRGIGKCCIDLINKDASFYRVVLSVSLYEINNNLFAAMSYR